MMFNSVEKAYEAIANIFLERSDGVEWASLRFCTTIVDSNCFGMELQCRKANGDEIGIGLGMQAGSEVNDATIWIRDELFRTTGQRIWGLTFTLYPSGKFNIEYDYNRPDWYTEETEQADIEAERSSRAETEAQMLGLRLNSLGVEVEINAPPGGAECPPFLSDTLLWLREQTARLGQAWGLGSEAAWSLDMNAGTLSFAFQDGREVVCPVQVVGTYNTVDGTFLWGWDHPSVPDSLRRAAQHLRDFGKANSIDSLTHRTVKCSEVDAWAYAAAAASLDKSIGAYRGKAGSTWVYMSFSNPVVDVRQ